MSETQLAERATGYLWGEPRLRGFVEEIRAEAEAAGDDRLEQVARRSWGDLRRRTGAAAAQIGSAPIAVRQVVQRAAD